MSDPAGGAAPFELQGGLAHRLARLGFLALAMVVWVRTAWLCDDAFITLRHVDHLTQGHGPFFNLDERVIGFTHPLWFFALVPVWWASASAAVTLFLVPFVFTAATLWMLSTKLAPSATRVMLAGALLLSSRAFVDWSSKWTNLTLARRDRPIPRRELVKNISAQWDGKGRIAVAEAVGILAWYAGSGVHVVDRNGLTDPLLARLPFERQDTWRPGHLARALPDGYRETLDSGTSAIADPCVAALWKDVAMATRSPLTTDGRAAAIWRLLVHDSRGPQAAYPEACPAAASP